jgi:peptidoglycan hydrolase-like protein with peptidoglycan-binding domain
MEGRDQRDPGYDDWFDEPEPPPSRRRRGQRRAAEPGLDETWVAPSQEARRAPREPLVIGGREVTTTQLGIVAVSAVVLLLAILAAAGAFSGGGKTAAPPTVPHHTTPPPKVTPSNTTPVTTPTTPAPTSTLKPGDTGAQVTVLQHALASLGYSVGKADGSYGPATKSAVAAFQTAQGLTADGVVGTQTLAALATALGGSSSSSSTSTSTSSTSAQAPTATLKPGDTGSQVTLLQEALASLGYSPGKADGSYGPGTKTAVQSFQTAQGLAADGVLGAKTLAALQAALSRG